MLALFTTVAASAVALRASERQRLLQTRVRLFRYTNGPERAHRAAGAPGLMGAVLDLATRAQVPICFEAALPEETSATSLFVLAQNQTVEAILRDLLRQDPRYMYRERLGVIEVLPRKAVDDPTDCLNLVIPELEVHYPWKYAFVEVKCQLGLVTLHPKSVVADPIASGQCSGAGHLSHAPAGVLVARFQHATVREILDRLAAMAGNVAWYATFNGASPTCGAVELGEYQPETWYPDDHRWVRGLPPGCRNCHYHQLSRSP